MITFFNGAFRRAAEEGGVGVADWTGNAEGSMDCWVREREKERKRESDWKRMEIDKG